MHLPLESEGGFQGFIINDEPFPSDENVISIADTSAQEFINKTVDLMAAMRRG